MIKAPDEREKNYVSAGHLLFLVRHGVPLVEYPLIHGSAEFKVVDALMTNFHLPRSSLLVMIEAFVGPRWKDLYRTALDEGYRFLSLGDAMFIKRSK